MKKIIISFLCGLAFVCPSVFASYANFYDVHENDWYYTDVMNMTKWDVIRGNNDGSFAPSRYVNRAELATMWNRYDENRLKPLKGSIFNLQTAGIADMFNLMVFSPAQDGYCNQAISNWDAQIAPSYKRLYDMYVEDMPQLADTLISGVNSKNQKIKEYCSGDLKVDF